MQTRKIVVFMMLALALVLGTAVVHAITIVVDGVKEAAWDGEGGQVPGIAEDDNELNINDSFDIKEVRWTNDSTGGTPPYGYMYWLIETWAPFDLSVVVVDPTILICLNVDNNTGTGITASGYCNNMVGIDRRIVVQPSLGTVIVQRPNAANTSWLAVASPAGGMRSVAWMDDDEDDVADHPYIEVGVDLQSLNITGGATCIATMPAAIYYDNGIEDPEDSTPNSGTIDMGCGSPTAVSLQSFTSVSSNLPAVGLVGMLALVIVSFGIAVVRRERRA